VADPGIVSKEGPVRGPGDFVPMGSPVEV